LHYVCSLTVAKTNLHRIEMINSVKIGRNRRSDDIEASEKQAHVEKNGSTFLGEDNTERSEQVNRFADERRWWGRNLSFLAFLSVFEVGEEGDVPTLWWDGSIAYDGTTSFWEHDDKDEKNDARENDKEPKDGAPA
jgi:hypothetical protein